MGDFRMLSLNDEQFLHDANVIFLQETHSTINIEKQRKAEFGAPLQLAHGSRCRNTLSKRVCLQDNRKSCPQLLYNC